MLLSNNTTTRSDYDELLLLLPLYQSYREGCMPTSGYTKAFALWTSFYRRVRRLVKRARIDVASLAQPRSP